MIIVPVRGKNREQPENGERRLRALFISDTHITNENYRRVIFTKALKGIKRFSPDTVVFAGDCTDNGNDENWGSFCEITEKHCPVNKRIVAIGNHDTWLSYDEEHFFPTAREKYLRYSNSLTDKEHTEVYFRYEINGYTFLVMGTEGTSVAADISDAQLGWLREELDAADGNKPVFVVNHHPLNFTHGVGNNERGMGINGDASDKLREILCSRENIIYFCGHLHFGFTKGRRIPLKFSSFERIGKNLSVCLPSCEYGSMFAGFIGSPPFPGGALIMDVYDKKTSLYGCDLITGRILKRFRLDVFPEKDGKSID